MTNRISKLMFLPAALACVLVASAQQPASTSTDLAAVVKQAAVYEPGASIAPFRRIEELVRESDARPSLKKPLEAALLTLLTGSSTYEAKWFACTQLAVVATENALPAIAPLLKNEETVGIACLALSTIHSGKANEIIRGAVESSKGKARVQLINTLGDRKDAGAVSLVTELAFHGDPAVAEAATASLGKIANANACKALASLRAKGLNAVVTSASLQAAQNLALAGNTKDAAAIYQELLQPSLPVNVRRGVFASLLRLDRDDGEQRIMETIHGSDAVLKPVAIAHIRNLKSRAASEKFAAEMATMQPQEQVWLIEVLASRGDAAARQTIRKSVCASESCVRMTAVAAIGRLDDDSVELLCQRLGATADRDERKAVEQVLCKLRPESPADAIVAEAMEKAVGEVKAELIGVIAGRAMYAALPALLREAGSSDAATASAAFQALGRMAAARDLPAMLDKLINLRAANSKSDAENAVAKALARIEDAPRRTEPVRSALGKASSAEVRASLLKLLLVCGDADALAAVTAAMKDADDSIRETAVRTLAQWPSVAAWDALVALCRQPEKPAYRTLGFRALVRLAENGNKQPDAALMGRYQTLLSEARTADERKLVVAALAGAATPASLQLVLPLANDESVGAEAALAAKKIAQSIKAAHPKVAADALKQLNQAKK